MMCVLECMEDIGKVTVSHEIGAEWEEVEVGKG